MIQTFFSIMGVIAIAITLYRLERMNEKD